MPGLIEKLRFFGNSKQMIRHSLGCGSTTTNTVVANLGAEPLLAYQQLQRAGPALNIEDIDISPDAFQRQRQRIRDIEAPGIRRRSMARCFEPRIEQLRRRWFGVEDAEADA